MLIRRCLTYVLISEINSRIVNHMQDQEEKAFCLLHLLQCSKPSRKVLLKQEMCVPFIASCYSLGYV